MKEISFIKDKRKYLHGMVLAFAALAAGLFFYFYSFLSRTGGWNGDGGNTEECHGREIGEMLEERGVIRSAPVFRVMLLTTETGRRLKAGTIHSGRARQWRRRFRF